MHKTTWLFAAGCSGLGALIAATVLGVIGAFGWGAHVTSNAAAAWVQAVGSILAIVATAMIARREHLRTERLREADLELRRRVFAFNAHPYIQDSHAALVKAIMLWVEFRPPLITPDPAQEGILLSVELAFGADQFIGFFSANDFLTLGKEGIFLHKAASESRVYLRLWNGGLRRALANGENFDNLRPLVHNRLASLHKLVQPTLQKTQAILDETEKEAHLLQ